MSDSTPVARAEEAKSLALGRDFGEWLDGLDEPDFMRRRRWDAFERFEALPLPTRKSEEWRYTDITGLDLDVLELLSPGEARDVPRDELPEPVLDVLEREQERSGIAVLVNGTEVHRRLDPELREQGVTFSPISRVAKEDPDLLEQWLFTSQVAEMEEKFWALHVAVLTQGHVLHVPKNVAVRQPIHTFRYLDRAGSLYGSHTLVVAEEGAEVTCIEEYLSPDMDRETVSVSGLEAFGAANATVRYISLQRYGRGVKHLGMQHATTGRDASLSGFNVALGSDLHRADVSSHLQGEGSESEMLAIWFGDDDQHIDHHTLQHHGEAHAYSDLLYKGALTDSAESVFRGLIRVDPGAQLTDAYQTNRNLLLSRDAHADTLPNLEIAADDVRCSHGATVGQVDEAQLFYLMTRGVTRKQAERLLVFGFFEEVLGRVPVEGVVSRVREAIERKMDL